MDDAAFLGAVSLRRCVPVDHGLASCARPLPGQRIVASVSRANHAGADGSRVRLDRRLYELPGVAGPGNSRR